jgi:outer membrane lipoprotein-sorting protein
MLKDLSAALSGAESLRAEYLYSEVTGVPTQYKITFAKPNKLRIENDYRLVLADGKNVIVYDKTKNTFSKEEQNEATFYKAASGEEVTLWTSFFFPGAFAQVSDPVWGGSVERSSGKLESVKFNFNGDSSAVLYMGPDKIVRQAELQISNGVTKRDVIFNVNDITLGGSIDEKVFQWQPRGGAQEVAADADRWYYTIPEGLEAAKKTKRLLFVDFYADW